jgi:lipopolysaccharide/colanic/teichoic acid biosynthesis glycosyltransferase
MSMTLDASLQTDLRPPFSGVEDCVHLPLVQQAPGNSYLAFKYAIDFCLAGLLLLLTAPVLLISALLVKLTSRGPMIYSQVRLGRDGRPYRIYKLRSMYHLCEVKSGPQWSRNGDPRITPLGRFLRRSHIDELPQLWNILRGEMSLIGPRPERPEFIPALTKAIPLYPMRLAVRPGVTGLAQVQLPADTDLASVRRKVAYDLYYVHQASLWIDTRILVATLFKVCCASFEFIRRTFLLPSPAAVQKHFRGLGQGIPAVESLKEPVATASINPEPVPAQ